MIESEIIWTASSTEAGLIPRYSTFTGAELAGTQRGAIDYWFHIVDTYGAFLVILSTFFVISEGKTLAIWSIHFFLMIIFGIVRSVLLVRSFFAAILCSTTWYCHFDNPVEVDHIFITIVASSILDFAGIVFLAIWNRISVGFIRDAIARDEFYKFKPRGTVEFNDAMVDIAMVRNHRINT
jgi:hypothetical protein